jgi:hypothetical protein
MVNVATVLRGALKLLIVRGAWTKDADAKNRAGIEVAVGDADACRWCLQGAVSEAGHRLKAHHKTRDAAQRAVRDAIQVRYDTEETCEFNDFTATRKHQVLGVLRRAIETVSSVVLVVLVSGCATPPTGQLAPSDSNIAAQVNSLRSLAKADVARGRDIFKAANDTDGVLCSEALLAEIPDGGTVGDALKPIGVWSTYAEGRTLHRKLAGFHVSESVHRACSPLLVDAESLLARLGALFGGGGILLPGLR